MPATSATWMFFLLVPTLGWKKKISNTHEIEPMSSKTLFGSNLV